MIIKPIRNIKLLTRKQNYVNYMAIEFKRERINRTIMSYACRLAAEQALAIANERDVTPA